MVCSTLSTSASFTPAAAGTLKRTFEVEAMVPTRNFASSPLVLWLEGYIFLCLLNGIVYEDMLLYAPVLVITEGLGEGNLLCLLINTFCFKILS